MSKRLSRSNSKQSSQRNILHGQDSRALFQSPPKPLETDLLFNENENLSSAEPAFSQIAVDTQPSSSTAGTTVVEINSILNPSQPRGIELPSAPSESITFIIIFLFIYLSYIYFRKFFILIYFHIFFN